MDIGTNTLTAFQNKYEGTHLFDTANEYGEPGYRADGMIFLGDWWCRCDKYDCLHGLEMHHPRLWAAMEEAGHEFEWHDEWMVDYETSKAYRTCGDSYSWTPSFVLTDDCEMLTPDSDVEAMTDWAINCADRALTHTLVDSSALVEAGWSQYGGELENGWYPGQTDDPRKILEALREEEQWRDVLFYISGTGQFDTRFKVYVRNTNND